MVSRPSSGKNTTAVTDRADVLSSLPMWARLFQGGDLAKRQSHRCCAAQLLGWGLHLRNLISTACKLGKKQPTAINVVAFCADSIWARAPFCLFYEVFWLFQQAADSSSADTARRERPRARRRFCSSFCRRRVRRLCLPPRPAFDAL